MPKTTTSPQKSSTNKRRPSGQPVVLSMGCPAGVGPELAAAYLAQPEAGDVLLVGDRGALAQGAEAMGMDPAWVRALPSYQSGPVRGVMIAETDGDLPARDRKPGRPTSGSGLAQLAWIEAGYHLAQGLQIPLVTLPVSKEQIAHSGLKRAKKFLGHTEWLEAMDGADYSVMCFAAEKLVTGLVTTHLPLRKVPRALTSALVARAIVETAALASALGRNKPKVAVCSLNPHAGEGELLGTEESTAIVPGVAAARKALGTRAEVIGPIGAETAIRKGAAGQYGAVVAMYHDQATIPMKLLDFGGTVNVTQGLSIVRTSVDHGTAYDIAGQGVASVRGLASAVRVARALGASRRR